jgi:hypothetical protein
VTIALDLGLDGAEAGILDHGMCLAPPWNADREHQHRSPRKGEGYQEQTLQPLAPEIDLARLVSHGFGAEDEHEVVDEAGDPDHMHPVPGDRDFY